MRTFKSILLCRLYMDLHMIFDFMLFRPLSWKTYLPLIVYFYHYQGDHHNNLELSTSLKKPTCHSMITPLFVPIMLLVSIFVNINTLFHHHPVPNKVTLQLVSSTTTTITVSWADPGGVQDYYEVDCGSDSSTPVQKIYPDDTFKATCAIDDASIDHTITVTAVSGDKSSATVQIFTPGGKCVVPR